jgi:hypothetical protein
MSILSLISPFFTRIKRDDPKPAAKHINTRGCSNEFTLNASLAGNGEPHGANCETAPQSLK